MENTTVLDKAQQIINEQFDKILKVSIDDNSYRIAIRRDEIPKIKQIGIYENKLIISFSDIKPKIDFQEDIYLKENEDGKIESIFISNFEKLVNQSHRDRIYRKLIDLIKNLPEGNKKKILQKHRNKRIVHSIAEIIKIIPDYKLPILGNDL